MQQPTPSSFGQAQSVSERARDFAFRAAKSLASEDSKLQPVVQDLEEVHQATQILLLEVTRAKQEKSTMQASIHQLRQSCNPTNSMDSVHPNASCTSLSPKMAKLEAELQRLESHAMGLQDGFSRKQDIVGEMESLAIKLSENLSAMALDSIVQACKSAKDAFLLLRLQSNLPKDAMIALAKPAATMESAVSRAVQIA